MLWQWCQEAVSLKIHTGSHYIAKTMDFTNPQGSNRQGKESGQVHTLAPRLLTSFYCHLLRQKRTSNACCQPLQGLSKQPKKIETLAFPFLSHANTIKKGQGRDKDVALVYFTWSKRSGLEHWGGNFSPPTTQDTNTLFLHDSLRTT